MTDKIFFSNYQEMREYFRHADGFKEPERVAPPKEKEVKDEVSAEQPHKSRAKRNASKKHKQSESA